MNYRLLLSEQRPLVSAGICAIFAEIRDIEVVGCVRDRRRTGESVAELRPHAVLIGAPRSDGDVLSTIQEVTAFRARVVLLVEHDADAELVKAVHAGARGVVRSDAAPADMVRAVREVAAGNVVLPPALTDALLATATARRRRRPPAGPAVGPLTDRETCVLRLIATGLTDGEIAATLRISVATVRSHVHHILTKLDLRDRVQAVAFAYRSGLAAWQPSTSCG